MDSPHDAATTPLITAAEKSSVPAATVAGTRHYLNFARANVAEAIDRYFERRSRALPCDVFLWLYRESQAEKG
jgi:hypothetical protein